MDKRLAAPVLPQYLTNHRHADMMALPLPLRSNYKQNKPTEHRKPFGLIYTYCNSVFYAEHLNVSQRSAICPDTNSQGRIT